MDSNPIELEDFLPRSAQNLAEINSKYFHLQRLSRLIRLKYAMDNARVFISNTRNNTDKQTHTHGPEWGKCPSRAPGPVIKGREECDQNFNEKRSYNQRSTRVMAPSGRERMGCLNRRFVDCPRVSKPGKILCAKEIIKK